VAVGGGAHALKNLKKQIPPMTRSKMVVPLPNQLLKMLKQCEVYLMEEAITDQIIRASSGPVPAANQDAFHADAMNDLQ